jgi:hypothetical protein
VTAVPCPVPNMPLTCTVRTVSAAGAITSVAMDPHPDKLRTPMSPIRTGRQGWAHITRMVGH